MSPVGSCRADWNNWIATPDPLPKPCVAKILDYNGGKSSPNPFRSRQLVFSSQPLIGPGHPQLTTGAATATRRQHVVLAEIQNPRWRSVDLPRPEITR
jgi:hypothetical protein